ncbi:hypothetical protein TIFTF001_031792 [Ficus carica]|uniref:Uncharacterized protein n=1 Tax=Ficus carica TaxID=3494 RepID=A0AA88DW62_FICCA|nr:hypothetical protein TIFTF001_031792 [Ficus carica]
MTKEAFLDFDLGLLSSEDDDGSIGKKQFHILQNDNSTLPLDEWPFHGEWAFRWKGHSGPNFPTKLDNGIVFPFLSISPDQTGP